MHFQPAFVDVSGNTFFLRPIPFSSKEQEDRDMARVTLIVSALVIALVAVFSDTTTAQTDTRDRTFLTFSGAVEMPGVTLPAGTYVFKLADTPSRNVVQVWDRDEKKMIGHWLFVQAERPEVSQDTVVMFKETAAGQTPAVHYWYYPGERIGKEFVYPKDQALKIAARTNERVLSTDGQPSPESSVSSIDAKGNVTEWKPEKAPAPQPQISSDRNAIEGAGLPRAESQQARAPEPPPAPAPAPAPRAEAFPQGGAGRSAAEEPAPQVTRTEPLPQTASPLALGALVGLLSLVGAAGVRFLR
jgi:hypothetical protein